MARRQSESPADAGPWVVFALVALVGLFAAIVLALVSLFNAPTAAAAAASVYCAGCVAMIVATGGARLSPLALWSLRLGLPLFGSAIVLVIALALG